MKKQLIALIAVFAFAGTSLFAQTTASIATKIGYTNVDFIVKAHPDSKKIQNEIEITKAQLDKALQDKYTEFQGKLDVYNKGASTMADVLRADKEKELQNLQTSIQDLQRNSENALQDKLQKLMLPLMDKINAAIQEVGKANNFLYIMNSDAGVGTTPVLLYVGAEENNVTDLVLKQMGVTPPKPDATPAAVSTAPKPATGATPKK